jgi:large subunit ribosomal protein L13
MKTKVISQKDINEKWYLIDANGQRIGRIASLAAELLMGKTSVLSRDYLDPKVKVVVINAEKIDFTAKRGFSKFYKSFSGYPGGLKFTSLDEMFKKNKTFPIENAVKGMLPKTKKSDRAIVNLKVYVGSEHPHTAQTPEEINIKTFKI